MSYPASSYKSVFQYRIELVSFFVAQRVDTHIYIYITVAVDLIYVQPLSSSRPVPSGLEWKQSEARLLLFDVIHLTFEIPENFTYQA